MARKAFCAVAWTSTYAARYGSVTGGFVTSDGVGSCSFGNQSQISITASNASSAGMNAIMLGLNSVNIADTGAGAKRFCTIGGLKLYAKKSGTQWVLEVSDSEGTPLTVTGATLFNFGTAYNISLVRQMASPYRGRVWVGTATDPEIDANFGSAYSTIITLPLGDLDNSLINFSVREVFGSYSDVDERIDASTADGRQMALSADGTDTGDTAYQDELGTPPTTPRYDSVDDVGTPDGDTTWIQTGAASGATYRQTYATTNITLANIQTIAVFTMSKATVNAKTASAYAISRDASVREEAIITEALSTTYNNYRAIFYRAPDGTTWDQTDLDALEVGTRLTTTAIVAWRDTAVYCEAMGCDYISLAAAAASRSRAFVF